MDTAQVVEDQVIRADGRLAAVAGSTEQLAYYSQSPGGSSGTITLPAPQGWTQADLENATALG